MLTFTYLRASRWQLHGSVTFAYDTSLAKTSLSRLERGVTGPSLVNGRVNGGVHKTKVGTMAVLPFTVAFPSLSISLLSLVKKYYI